MTARELCDRIEKELQVDYGDVVTAIMTFQEDVICTLKTYRSPRK